MMDNFLIINRLRVGGELGCDYKFGTGLNLIKGSNSTGKTTLMWFLDFAFGSSTGSDEFISPVKDECEWVYIDLIINNKYFTVKRSIRQPENIFVYQGIYQTIAELERQPSKIYGRKESKEKETITNFYFQNLHIPPGMVPISEAKVARYSWRNMMSLIYVQQDKWNGIQAQNNFQPEMKKAVFEILLGIDDKEINKLEGEKRDVGKALEDSKTRAVAIKQILDNMDRKIGSSTSLKELKQRISIFEGEKDELLKTLEVNEDSTYLLDDRNSAQVELSLIDEKLTTLKQRLENFEMLQNENELKLEKNRLLLKAKKIFSELPITKCPRCLNALVDNGDDKCFVCGQDYKDMDKESGYAQNLFLLMDDQKELTKIIQSLKEDILSLERQKQELTNSLIDVEKKIDHLNKEVISPVMKATEAINAKLMGLNKALGNAENIATLIQQEKNIQQSATENSQKMDLIQKAINDLLKDRVTATEVKLRFLGTMERILRDELNLQEKLVGFDRLYTPLFENGKILFKAGKEDINKSKGAKVILGYYTSIIEYSLKYGSYHPRLLMLDTPRQDELDLSVFAKILNYWASLSSYNKPYQIIITGSEFPTNNGRLIAEFHNQQASGNKSKSDSFSVYPITLQ
jgi:hypothetical protein